MIEGTANLLPPTSQSDLARIGRGRATLRSPRAKKGWNMNYETREALAYEFADVVRSIREEKWGPFCEAAVQIDLDPYVALGRMLVQMVEGNGTPDPSKN